VPGRNTLEGLCRRHRASKREISPVGRQRLLAYPWPGNVRELAHELERAIVFETGGSLQFDHLTGSERTQAMPVVQPEDWFNERFVIPANGFSVEEAVMRIIHHALKQSGENISAAAGSWECRATICAIDWNGNSETSLRLSGAQQ